MAGAVDVVVDKDVAIEAVKGKAKDKEWDVERKAALLTTAATARDNLHTMAAVANPSSRHSSNANLSPTQPSATTTGTSATPAVSTWKIGTPVPHAHTRTAATTTRKMCTVAIGNRGGRRDTI